MRAPWEGRSVGDVLQSALEIGHARVTTGTQEARQLREVLRAHGKLPGQEPFDDVRSRQGCVQGDGRDHGLRQPRRGRLGGQEQPSQLGGRAPAVGAADRDSGPGRQHQRL